MERPAKRIRTSDPEGWPRLDVKSAMNGLSIKPERYNQAEEKHEQHVIPTRTISLTDFQRRAIFNAEKGRPLPVLPRRNAGIYLLPRAAEATVTASVVVINVDDGTSTSVATQIPAATDATVVSLSNLGSLTVPGITSATGTRSLTDSDISQTSTTITSISITTTSDASSITSMNGPSTIISDANNGTSTDTNTDQTVTVTMTSTFDVSYINGTILTSHSTTPHKGAHSNSKSNHITASSSDPSGIVVPSTASSSAALTDGFGGAGALPSSGASPTSPGSSATSTSTSGSGSGSGNTGPGLTPQQQQVVGGVVGGVAGVAILLLVLLVFLRWYRRRLKSRGELPQQMANRNLTSGHGSSLRSMSQMSSGLPFASVLTSSLKRFRPHSSMTMATSTTGETTLAVPDSERGFQRIAGRKIAPVLGTGGDGYGGSYGAFEKDTTAGPSDPLTKNDVGLSTTSFYRDHDGFYGGKGTTSPTFPSSPTTTYSGARSTHGPSPGPGPSMTRDFAAIRPSLNNRNPSQISLGSPSKPEGMAVLRPSPARTPMTLSPSASSIRLPIQQPPTMDPDTPPLPAPGFLGTRDAVGRSLASQDGSRISGISRSSGRSGGRFVENLN